MVNKQKVILNERVKIVNKLKNLHNKDGKLLAIGYKVAIRPNGEQIIRADGVFAVESIGGIVCGETGYINGLTIKTVHGFLVGGDPQRSLMDKTVAEKELVYLIPVFLDNYQTTVYVQTDNIEFIN